MIHRHIMKCNTSADLHTAIVKKDLWTPWVALTKDDNKVHFNSVANLLKEYVDLSLPSGNQWSKYNLGAQSEEEYGLFYQYGSLKGYSDASHSTWETCPFNNGSKEYDEHYFETVISKVVDENFILNKTNDVAYNDTESIAHIPTEEDFKELYDNTIHSWEEINGVYGRKFTALNDSSKYIFIPAAGCVYDNEIYGRTKFGLVWASNLCNPNNSYATVFQTSETQNETGYQIRKCGFSIRPIYKKKVIQ